jgi:hypothetical protein
MGLTFPLNPLRATPAFGAEKTNGAAFMVPQL